VSAGRLGTRDQRQRSLALLAPTCLVRSAELQLREQLKAKWQVGGTFAIGQEAEVPDAHEPFGSRCNRKRRKNSSSERHQQSAMIRSQSCVDESRYFLLTEDRWQVNGLLR